MEGSVSREMITLQLGHCKSSVAMLGRLDVVIRICCIFYGNLWDIKSIFDIAKITFTSMHMMMYEKVIALKDRKVFLIQLW